MRITNLVHVGWVAFQENAPEYSKAVFALPAQYKEGMKSEQQVIDGIQRGIENRNPAVITVLNTMSQSSSFAKKVDYAHFLELATAGAFSVEVALGVLAMAMKYGRSGSMDRIAKATQTLMGKLDSALFLPFRGLTPQENLDALMEIDPANPIFFNYLERLETPKNTLGQVVEHVIQNQPAEPDYHGLARLLRRVLDQGAPDQTASELASLLAQASVTDAVMAFRALAERGIGKAEGKVLLEVLLGRSKTKITSRSRKSKKSRKSRKSKKVQEARAEHRVLVYQVAADMAAQGQLFGPDELLEVMMSEGEGSAQGAQDGGELPPAMPELLGAWLKDPNSVLWLAKPKLRDTVLSRLMSEPRVFHSAPLETIHGVLKARDAGSKVALKPSVLQFVLRESTAAAMDMYGADIIRDGIRATGLSPEEALGDLAPGAKVSGPQTAGAWAARMWASRYLNPIDEKVVIADLNRIDGEASGGPYGSPRQKALLRGQALYGRHSGCSARRYLGGDGRVAFCSGLDLGRQCWSNLGFGSGRAMVWGER